MYTFPHNIPNSDNKEFVLTTVFTPKGPLDPHGPFKIVAYDTAPAGKKQEYDQKKAALFNTIKERIDK